MKRRKQTSAKTEDASSDARVLKRKRVTEEGGGSYFTSAKSHIDFIGSGSTTLDCALGGGWAGGRIFNIVGDKSTGKTLLAIETVVNFARKHPKGRIRYAECEHAFDPQYAQALGMPLDRVDFGEPLETVEDMFEELNKLAESAKKEPTLYIVDSLDALSDRSEMDREVDQGSYGANKAKQLSQLFRRLTGKMSKSNMTLGVISQVRDNIGVSFGRKTTRSGGRALDFYASQVLYLAHLGTEKRTIKGIERPTAIKVRGKVDKNKVGLPYREAEFQILFGYGVDDIQACLQWLNEAKSLELVGVKKDDIKDYCRRLMKAPDAEHAATVKRIQDAVRKRWAESETAFLPTRRKYT
jgi:recombination protein RecA